MALLVGSFSTAALAAHTAVNQLVYIVFQIAVGLSHAASIGVSRELALGNTAAAQRLKTTALACAAGVMAVMAVVYLTVPRIILAPFFDSHDDRAMDTAVQLLLVAAVLQFFDCTQNIGVGLLRGLDDTKGGFQVTLARPADPGLAATALLLLRLFGRLVNGLPTRAAATTSVSMQS